jgi:hypothetical protein
MLKKMLKSCLVFAAACAIAAPVFASDALTMNGRVRGAMESRTIKDGASYMYFKSDLRLDVRLQTDKSDAGWQGYGFSRIICNSDKDIASTGVTREDNYVGLKSDAIDIRVGSQHAGGVNIFYPYWLGAYNAMLQFPGEWLVSRRDQARVILPMGLSVAYGMDQKASQGYAGRQTYEYDRNYANIRYDNFNIGPGIRLMSMFAIDNRSVNEKLGPALKDNNDDGWAGSDLAVGVGYPITKELLVGLNFSMMTTKGNLAADATIDTFTDIGVGYRSAGGDTAIAYLGTRSTVTGSGDPGTYQILTVDYTKALATGPGRSATRLNVGFSQESAKDNPSPLYGFGAKEWGQTRFGGGLAFWF